MKRDIDVLCGSSMPQTDLQDELDLMRWETDGSASYPRAYSSPRHFARPNADSRLPMCASTAAGG